MSEEIAWAREIADQRARITQLEAIATTLRRERDEAEAREHTAVDSYVRMQDNQRRLEAELSERESQLGAALAEIARLEAAFNDAAEQARVATRREWRGYLKEVLLRERALCADLQVWFRIDTDISESGAAGMLADFLAYHNRQRKTPGVPKDD